MSELSNPSDAQELKYLLFLIVACIFLILATPSGDPQRLRYDHGGSGGEGRRKRAYGGA